jgi:hypothetical protein
MEKNGLNGREEGIIDTTQSRPVRESYMIKDEFCKIILPAIEIPVLLLMPLEVFVNR